MIDVEASIKALIQRVTHLEYLAGARPSSMAFQEGLEAAAAWMRRNVFAGDHLAGAMLREAIHKPVGEAPGDYWECQKCGHESHREYVECLKCGTAREAPVSAKTSKAIEEAINALEYINRMHPEVSGSIQRYAALEMLKAVRG